MNRTWPGCGRSACVSIFTPESHTKISTLDPATWEVSIQTNKFVQGEIVRGELTVGSGGSLGESFGEGPPCEMALISIRILSSIYDVL